MKGDIKKGADLLNEILMFRAKMKLNGSIYHLKGNIFPGSQFIPGNFVSGMKESDLNAELREKGGVYFKGVDKQGRPIRELAL